MTFWQVSVDMPLSMEPGPGHGHNFSGEHVDAWATVLNVRGWTAERAARLKAAVQTGLTEPYTAAPSTAGGEAARPRPNCPTAAASSCAS